MLERTAATTLEACNLQRALHSQTRSVRTRRQLHAAFWQHGAAALDIYNQWPSSTRAAEVALEDGAPQQHPTALVASIFLLDFLYPKPTHSLIRRTYPGSPRFPSCDLPLRQLHQDSHQPPPASTTADPETPSNPVGDEESSHTAQRNESATTLPERGGQSISRFSNEDQTTQSPSPAQSTADTRSRGSLATAMQQAQNEIENHRRSSGPTTAQMLVNLISTEESNYHQAWDVFCALPPEEKERLRPYMISHLARASGIVEAGRAILLFQQVSPDQWDDELLAIAIQLLLQSGDTAQASEILKEGFQHGIMGGLDDFVADCLDQQNWQILIETWLSFTTSFANYNWAAGPMARQKIRALSSLQTLEDIGYRCIAFEQYLIAENVFNKHSDPASKDALDFLRQRIVKAALRQPCPFRQAEVILRGMGDPKLYYDYLSRTLPKKDDEEAYSTREVAHFTQLYKKFRQMPGAAPSVRLYRGIFRLAYPSDIPTLMILFEDWHKLKGHLDQYGYRRFLALFATMGDVKRVQALWREFVSHYPEALQRPNTFSSLINVYAQVGDVNAAEKELKNMRDTYDLQPSLNIMNTMLKCYIKAQDYDGAYNCYQRLKQLHKPDSYTFAHLMNISAKNGDIDETLRVLNDAQEAQVSISKEIVLAVVLAYCRNGKLPEAEKACIGFAEHKITSVAAWNLLINYHGMHCNLPECYRLLQTMRRYGVEFNNQTYEFLFRALAKAGQYQHARRFLKQAGKESLFQVTSQHYAVVMEMALRQNEVDAVERMAAELQELGLDMNFNALVVYMKAYMSKMPEPHRLDMLKQELVNHMRALIPSSRENAAIHASFDEGNTDHLYPNSAADLYYDEADPSKLDVASPQLQNKTQVSIGDPRLLGIQTQQFGQAILLLAELNDDDAIEELVTLYGVIFPSVQGLESLPSSVISAIMAAYLRRNQTKQVMDLWPRFWTKHLARSRNAEGQVLPQYLFSLNRPLQVMIPTFSRLNDGDGLLDCIQQVISSGFSLTSSTWEMTIWYLVEMDKWDMAVEWCEQELMPFWGGWRKIKRNLRPKRHQRDSQAGRPPSKATIRILQRKWLEMRKVAAWSPEVSSKLQDLSQRCPKIHYAMLTADSTALVAEIAAARSSTLKQSLDKMISRYTVGELKILKDILLNELKKILRSRSRRTTRSSRRARMASTGATRRDVRGLGPESAMHMYKSVASLGENADHTREPQSD